MPLLRVSQQKYYESKMTAIEAFVKLKEYCESEQFKGWDPYDGLNSKVFQAVPFFRKSAFFRLAMIQGFKRSPVNFRRLALVPKGYNAKGIGLFLQGYCNLYSAVRQNPYLADKLGTEIELLKQINNLSDLLLSLRSEGYSGACWGYNFDWQIRFSHLFPKNTPTIVATSFCATALFEAADLTGREDLRKAARSSADFVINDLHRKEHLGGILFSYSPLPGNDTVFNASLLGTRLLSYCYKDTGKQEYKDLARQSALACCNSQAEDGSWVYGLLRVQDWIDSFHTGYNLDGLSAYEEITGDKSFHDFIERGVRFYIEHFFESDGCPKYYADKKFPIDIHCPGQLPVTLSRLGRLDAYRDLADKVLNWTLVHMQNRQGYFYYQLKPKFSSKISYMRWSNAFMFYALSYYILNTEVHE